MTPEFLKNFMNEILETAKENIEHDGELMPMVFLIRRDSKEILGVPIDMGTDEQKARSYGTVFLAAKQFDMEAAVFLNDSYMKSMSSMDPCSHYDLAVDPEATECIMVAAKGPSVAPFGISLQYRRGDLGNIEWLGRIEMPGATINLMQNWWEEPILSKKEKT